MLVRESITGRRKLISVDVQPAHLDHIHFKMADLVEYMNEFDDVLYLFNGEEMGYDSPAAVKNFLVNAGADEELLVKITFLEKSYGFFRGGMDEGVYEDELVEVIEHMIENDINSSDDIDFGKLGVSGETADALDVDTIYLPDISLDIVRRYDGSIVVGGANDECLAEMEILFEAMGLDYEENRKFIYW